MVGSIEEAEEDWCRNVVRDCWCASSCGRTTIETVVFFLRLHACALFLYGAIFQELLSYNEISRFRMLLA